jgi:putative endonuclease
MPTMGGGPALPGHRFRHPSERRAARWYRLRGYRVLATNVWIAGNELDVVARRGSTLVFCEVKSKSGSGYGDPLEMVSPEKARRVRRAAEAWLAARPDLSRCQVRFDVIAVRGHRLECLRQAF